MINNIHNEIWLPIKGHEGLYEVSNKGRIKSLPREVVRFGFHKENVVESIRPPKKDKYLRIELSKEGINKIYPIHRLVAIAFIENPNNKPFINHKDGNKYNNSVENLEWCTHSENQKYSFDVLKRSLPPMAYKSGEDHPNFGKGHLISQCKKIKCDTLGIEFNSEREACRLLGVNTGALSNVLNGKYTHTKGLTFRYL